MAEPFIGEIRIWSMTWNPRGWAYCDGSLLPIAQHTALFSLLGTSFGGDGRVSFGLPDLRSSVPVGVGSSFPRPGMQGGSNYIQLTQANLPAHTHEVVAQNGDATATEAKGAFPAKGITPAGRLTDPWNSYAPDTSSSPIVVEMAEAAIHSVGGNQVHENRQPFLGMNFCIALEGLYPTRP